MSVSPGLLSTSSASAPTVVARALTPLPTQGVVAGCTDRSGTWPATSLLEVTEA